MTIRLTPKQYKELLGMQCPYCRAALCDNFTLGAAHPWMHFIPGTDFKAPCEASRLRGKFLVKSRSRKL